MVNITIDGKKISAEENITIMELSLIHISEPTRRTPISYAVFCLKKKNTQKSRMPSSACTKKQQLNFNRTPHLFS